MRDSKSKEISRGAILTVLSVLILYASTVLVTTKLSLLVAGSIIVAVGVIELKVRGALLVYVSSSVLGVILVPDKLFMISYICFFGCYPILKYTVERIDMLILEWILKLMLFNITAIAGYGLANIFLIDRVEIAFPIWALVILMQGLFAAYDYGMSLAIGYYLDRIRPKLNMGK